MAQKVLVVIPTVASTLDLERIKDTIRKMSASLHYIGLEPVFHIAHPRGTKMKLKRALVGLAENVTFYERRGKGFGEAIISAISNGIASHSPDFVMTGFADYLHESRYAGNLIKPLLERQADFTTGSWQNRRATALEVPLPQYLNETRVSAAVTYANPHFKPSNLAPHAAVNEAVNSGKGFQTFAGFLAFRASHWPTLQGELNSTFRRVRKHVYGWGIEPALLLSALKRGLRVVNAPFPRGYEHDFPKEDERERFVAGRLRQFNDGMAVVRHFLYETGQSYKFHYFNQAVPHERRKIQLAPLRIQRYDKALERFGPEFLYQPRTPARRKE